MSYFEHTKKDVEDARLAARKEIGDVLAALADDSSRKMDDENTDRQTVAEDLITRLVTLSKALGSDAAGLFDSLANFSHDNPMLPLDGEEVTAGSQDKTIDLTPAIRAAWEAQTFNGIPRHEHVGMPDDRCYHSFSGVRCNHYFGHAVHETVFEERSEAR